MLARVPTIGADVCIHLSLLLDFTLAVVWVKPKGPKALYIKCGGADDEEGDYPEHNAAGLGNLRTKYPTFPWMCLGKDNDKAAVECNCSHCEEICVGYQVSDPSIPETERFRCTEIEDLNNCKSK